MNHQPDIGFVYPHPESVGCRDHPQIARAEAFLHRLLVVCGQAGVEMLTTAKELTLATLTMGR